MTASTVSDAAVAAFRAREAERFRTRNPASLAQAEAARAHFFAGVPMHWMSDWSTPYPLFVERAQGARFWDADGHEYADFCLGDTGAMFGHSPAPVARALAAQGARGLTTMLPSRDTAAVGELLARRFGLPYWQVAATATDANRYVLRWARAVTGRKTVLVFDGCYHGTVDDAMVRLDGPATRARPGLIGQAHDLGAFARAVPFNNLNALEEALKPGDVACVLMEPAMTNIGMVLPDPGFHAALRALTRRHGTLLVIDETHTISTGPGGCTRAWGLEPDFFVLGKPVAGGLPCSVFGCTAAVAALMGQARAKASAEGGHGHSGMGTTLSANMLALAAMRANLSEVMTEAAYDHMLALAKTLAAGLRAVFARHALPWSVSELGARCEFQFCATPPRTGAEAEAAFHDALQQALHLYLINRGVLITPFHNMMLVCPDTAAADVAKLVETLDAGVTELLSQPGAREG